MTTIAATPTATSEPISIARTDERVRPLVVAAVASLSAGAIHAAAIGSHAEHPQAARVFAAVALFQLVWGAAALARPGRVVALLGILGNAALFGGWVVAKTSGLSFVDGLDTVEPAQFADTLAAALAGVAVLAAVTIFLRLPNLRGRSALTSGLVAVLTVAALPGMIQAGRHVHAHSHAGDQAATSIVVGANGKASTVTGSAVVPPKPFDPTKPIDLGGVPGVTLEQQARAENVLAITLLRLPQWSDPAKAEANGFSSIADGITGTEHLINWSYIDDGRVLDPDHPESLVYKVSGNKRTLVAAMYMLPQGSTLESVPDVGGALTQWHIHDNLCFTNDPKAPKVVGITGAGGRCRGGLVKLQPVPMIHVWIVSHPCGPFAALEGVGAGQIKAGEARSCDHVHGSGGGL
jgi:hypothetical protein